LSRFDKTTGEVWLWTTFSEDQVDINIKNPNVLLELIDILLFYCTQGAKFIRLDAIAFLWKEIGTNCIHLNQTHEVVKLFRDVLDIAAPQVIIITETNVPHEENISYFGNQGDEAQMVYQFPLPPLCAHSLLREDFTWLSNWISSLPQSSEKTMFFNFTASHDGIGVRPVTGLLPDEELDFLVQNTVANGGDVSYKNNPDGTTSPYELNINYMDMLTPEDHSDEVRTNRFLLSQAILLSMPGVPGIYFHSLYGSRNWKEGVKLTGRLRTINREKLCAENTLKELNDTANIRNKVFSSYKKMLNARANCVAFHPVGEFSSHLLEKSCFLIKRSHEDVTCLGIFNAGTTPFTASLEQFTESEYLHDILNQEEIPTSKVEIPALSFLWLIPQQ
jgi:sucrose phosphorylase